LLVGLSSPSHAETAPTTEWVDPGPTPGDRQLTSRLMAPCCWTQTIDIHDSQIAASMRAEVRVRLRRGDSIDAIQADMVARFGPRIIAISQPGVLSATTILVAFAAIAMVGVLAVSLRRQGRKQAPQAAKTGPSSTTTTEAARDSIDQQIDDELRDLEDFSD
jgi:cytochrome c-type biogenesis protein CcmH